ncbi:ADP-ribosylglycohydrolase family protein [Treponema primitia]|uniref:ADP-ribosylglycohydrolase family protein n=1 Tax=Treponema primitia TaxID=88058 RepID=UPI003980B24A
MKAWEYTFRKTQNAFPVILSEDEQTWRMMSEFEKNADALLKTSWSSNVPGSSAPECLIAGAIQSMENMGYRVDEAERLFEEGLAALAAEDLQKLNILTAHIWQTMDTLPVDTQSSYWNYRVYRDFETYEQTVSLPAPIPVDVKSNDFYDRTYAAWIARISGGALGTALEGYTAAQLRKKFGEIRSYVREPNTYNDDITYEIAFLTACEQKGPLVSSADIADQWLALIPMGWSAEQIALDNLRRGIYPPESGFLKNPYREWIGAQMRGAICGQLAPGNPREAARLAWLDGVISHAGNGVLGEVFNALLVSISFVEADPRRCLDRAIGLIPADSEYHSVIQFAREQAELGDFAAAWAACEDQYKQYNWIHAYPNAAAEVIALWFGNGNFDETMYHIAMCGQDVDCNAAQIAAVLGAQQGRDAIQERWLRPLGDTVLTYLRDDMKRIELTSLVDKTVRTAGLFNRTA